MDFPPTQPFLLSIPAIKIGPNRCYLLLAQHTKGLFASKTNFVLATLDADFVAVFLFSKKEAEKECYLFIIISLPAPRENIHKSLQI